jgi:hypothetical protein
MFREEDHIAGENFCKRHKISIAAKKCEHETPLDTNDVACVEKLQTSLNERTISANDEKGILSSRPIRRAQIVDEAPVRRWGIRRWGNLERKECGPVAIWINPFLRMVCQRSNQGNSIVHSIPFVADNLRETALGSEKAFGQMG